jgi:hypothetical protein
MSLRTTLAAAAVAIATLSAAGANAAVLYSDPSVLPEQVTGTSHVVTFNATAGAADLSFVLDGYASLDGQNWYEDDFTLNLNGIDIFKATFNLGGGGNDVIFSNLAGLTADNVSGNGTDVTWAGGHVNIAGPIGLQAGTNTLTFSYAALPSDGGAHAGWQDMGDEGWGVENVLVSRSDAGGVPEPATWGLMLMGFGGLGAMLRRSRSLDALVRA